MSWTRRVLPLSVSAAILAIGVGCGGDDEEGEVPVSGTFVGQVEQGLNRPLGIAVDADSPAGDGERAVRVYACDGKEFAEWLPGTLSGNEGEFRSTDGDSRASVSLEAERASGTLTLAGGQKVEFSIPRATGRAGLYLVRGDGLQVQGASTEGAILDIEVTAAGKASGTIVEADGTEHGFSPGTRVDPIPSTRGLLGRFVVTEEAFFGAPGLKRPLARTPSSSGDFLVDLSID